MAEQQQWFAGEPNYENWGLAVASDSAARAGHLAKARELTKRAVDSAVRVDEQRERRNLSGECCSSRSGVWQRCGSAGGQRQRL